MFLVNTSFGKKVIVMQVFCRVSSLSRDAQTTAQTPNNSYSFSGVVPRVFPGQLSDIVVPACFASSPGSPRGETCQRTPPEGDILVATIAITS